MTDAQLIVMASLVFLFVVMLMVLLRARAGEKFDVRNTDVLVAVIPVAVWLIVSGKITMFEAAGIKIQTAIVQASQATIAKDVTKVKLPVEPVVVDPKAGVEQIPRLIRNKTEALLFQLGYGGYYGPAIEEYLRELSRAPFFKYIVLTRPDGTFFGLADGRELSTLLTTRDGRLRSEDFARALKLSDEAALAQLPGFLSAADAIRPDADKRTALEQMEARSLERLPVVDEARRFVGVVDRSHLASSLIIEVARRVK